MSERRVYLARWRAASLLLSTLVGAGCAGTGLRAGDALNDPGPQVTSVLRRVERDGPSDNRPDFCQDFRLSPQQVRAYLVNAREVDAIQFHNEMWLPCLATAEVRQGGREFSVAISASFVAWASYPDGRQRWFVCDAACQTFLKYELPK